MAPGHILQIFLRLTVQNQFGIRQWGIINQVVQFRPLCHGDIQRVLNPGAVDGDFSPIPKQQLHTSGIHVERTGSCIVLHNRVLLKSVFDLFRSIYDFGFQLLSETSIELSEENKKSDPISYRKQVRIIFVWSEWRDSNSRPPAPKAGALPTAQHPGIRRHCCTAGI